MISYRLYTVRNKPVVVCFAYVCVALFLPPALSIVMPSSFSRLTMDSLLVDGLWYTKFGMANQHLERATRLQEASDADSS